MGSVIGFLFYLIFVLLMLPFWVLWMVGYILQLPWEAVKDRLDRISLF